jgi:hypothetical protein
LSGHCQWRGEDGSPADFGHRSISVCHLLNITRELGRRVKWDPERETFLGDEKANKLFDRPRRAGFELPEV